MADDETTPPAPEPAPTSAEPAPAKAAPRRRTKPAPKPEPAPETAAAEATAKEAREEKEAEARIPRRAELSSEQRTLLRNRKQLDRRRPLFGRQARYRYYRIGRDMAWRRPRGLQSKQRRHYGYRPRIVRIGYRSPAGVRGLVPSGFRPVLVRTGKDLERIDARREAAVIARTVGTRRRLVLEEEARKLGIHVLNPIVKPEQEA